MAIKSGLIDRENFLSFCNELTIILEMPKASLDLKNPGGIENVIIQQVEKLGVGIYPNDNLNLEEVIYKLATEVKHSRAMGNRLYTNTLMAVSYTHLRTVLTRFWGRILRQLGQEQESCLICRAK